VTRQRRGGGDQGSPKGARKRRSAEGNAAYCMLDVAVVTPGMTTSLSPWTDPRRDLEWRPVDPMNDEFDHAPWHDPWLDDVTALYYWRPEYSRLRSSKNPSP